MNVRGRVLAVRGALLAESRRLGKPDALPTPGALLESLAGELEDVALELLDLGVLDLDGPLADGPAEVAAQEAEDFDAADTVELEVPEWVPRAKPQTGRDR